jgi:hypothetical protein
VSLTLLPLLSSSLIKVVLELYHFTASMTHLFPSPITPVGLAGDLTAASARHLTVDWPSRASNDQISPTTVIPYLRSYLATIPSTQNRTTGEEPPSGSPATGSHRRGPPPDAVTTLSLARGPTPMVPAAPFRSSVGWLGRLPACVHLSSLGQNLPRPSYQGIPFLFPFFHFFFLFSYIYRHIFDILCTKNNLNKL